MHCCSQSGLKARGPQTCKFEPCCTTNRICYLCLTEINLSQSRGVCCNKSSWDFSRDWDVTTDHMRLRYYTLRSSLHILRSALLDDGTSRAGDLTSDSVLSRGSIISKRPHVFECMHVTCALKHNTHMIRLYRTSIVYKDMNNANWVALIVKLYSVTMNNRNTECE